MNDKERERYEELISHLPWHHARRWAIKGAMDARRWAINGAEKEDARTILNAIHRLSRRDFNRRFAEMLAKD